MTSSSRLANDGYTAAAAPGARTLDSRTLPPVAGRGSGMRAYYADHDMPVVLRASDPDAGMMNPGARATLLL